MFIRLLWRTSPFPSVSSRWNGNIFCRLNKGFRSDCDVHLQHITPLSVDGKSCSAYPVSALTRICGSATRDPATYVPRSVKHILEYYKQASSPYLRRDFVLTGRIQRQALNGGAVCKPIQWICFDLSYFNEVSLRKFDFQQSTLTISGSTGSASPLVLLPGPLAVCTLRHPDSRTATGDQSPAEAILRLFHVPLATAAAKKPTARKAQQPASTRTHGLLGGQW